MSLLLPDIYIYTYGKLQTCIVCLRSSFTGVKRLLWFIWKNYIEIYIGTQAKCTKRWKQSSAFNQFLEILLLVIKVYTEFITDVIWVKTKVCSVTSKPTQSSSRHFSYLMNSSTLLNKRVVNFTKVKLFLSLSYI